MKEDDKIQEKIQDTSYIVTRRQRKATEDQLSEDVKVLELHGLHFTILLTGWLSPTSLQNLTILVNLSLYI